MATDAFSAFNITGAATAPFGFGGFNAGPATFSPAANCFGISGYDCRVTATHSGAAPNIGRIASATNIGAATLAADALNVLGFTSAGPSTALFYTFDGGAPVDLVASYKALANGATAEVKVALFRVTFGPVGAQPTEIVSVLMNESNRSGTLTTTLTTAGTYGVHVMPTAWMGDVPANQRTDWVGLNLSTGGLNAPIPEPASWAMLIIGFAAVGGAVRARPRAAFA